VVWENPVSASRALLALGRQPVALCSNFEDRVPPVALSTDDTVPRDQNQAADQNQTHGNGNQIESGGDRSNQNTIESQSGVEQAQEQDCTQAQAQTKTNSGGSGDGNKYLKSLSLLADTSVKNQGLEEGECAEDVGGTQGKDEEECVVRSRGAEEENLKKEVEGCENSEGPTSPAVQWRLGESHPKAKMLLLRFATELDVKKRGAAVQSEYYMKYGRPPMPPDYLATLIKEKRREKKDDEGRDQEEAVEKKQDLRLAQYRCSDMSQQ
jgi:hypothetical protein